MSVEIEVKDGQAVVFLHNPPVNAIGQSLRSALLKAVQEISRRDDVDRVILTGRGKTFAAGADAREFDSDPEEPHLPDVILAIEQSSLPWIAAINGVALGGGLELCLGCRYRIASPRARLGLPEVTLGVVPGAGGTQRLPRLIGVEKALSLIAEGRAIKADEAHKWGLVDALAEDALGAARSLDLSCLGGRSALSEAPAPAADDARFEAARTKASKRQRLEEAPQQAIDLVCLSTEVAFDEAVKRERDAFLSLRRAPQAKALRHIFFAERQAKLPDLYRDGVAVEIDKAVVIGGGTMGAGIAYALDRAGIKVTICENDEEGVLRARNHIARLADSAEKRGLLSQDEAKALVERIGLTTSYNDMKGAELIIEAAFESMDVKKEIFSRLNQVVPEDTILATNTSYLDLNEIASVVHRPERVIGLHFFSPAHIMKLLEIVKGEASDASTIASAYGLASRLGKIPVLSGVCDGFIGNRILARYREAADTLLMDGSTPWEIDEAMVAFGYPMGPYEAQDLSGLDIAFANRERQKATRDPGRRYIPIADRMVQEGRLGRKTGVGWYRYPGGNGKVTDPLVEDLIAEEAHFAKVKRRHFSQEDIQVRLLSAMINEAAAILDERIAFSARDIDLVTVFGYGFPRWRGGLMFYADQMGSRLWLERLTVFCKKDPLVWKPARLLSALAADDGSFARALCSFVATKRPLRATRKPKT